MKIQIIKKPNKYNFGGVLQSNGGNWNTGITVINGGQTHEESPYGGIPFGIAPDGQENLVEKNEAIWKDYVFSDRLNTPEEFKNNYKLGGNLNTYADIATYMADTYKERSNDPIAQKTLDDFMARLAQSQESERQRLAQEEALNMFANGGGLSRKEDYGSKKKPYPSVKKKDFAGGGRSYPIPTKADAVDALRLAGLHHRPDVKAKVYRKYPELKHDLGGHLFDFGSYLNFTNPPVYEGLPDGYLLQGELPQIVPVESSYYIPEYNWYHGADNIPIAGQSVEAKMPEYPELKPEEPKKLDISPSTESHTNGWNATGMAMRLASALGPALGALSATWTKPDYKWSNKLIDMADRYAGGIPEVSYNPIRQYLAFRPFDRLFYLNRLDSNIAANKRAALNLVGGNKAAALAALNAQHIKDMENYGQLARAGEEYNQAQREKSATFNRDTDKFNSTMDLEAQKTNATLKEAKARMQLQSLMQALGWNRQDDILHANTLSQNLTQLFNNIGGVGTEIMNRADRKTLADSGIWGVLNDLMKRNQIIGG